MGLAIAEEVKDFETEALRVHKTDTSDLEDATPQQSNRQMRSPMPKPETLPQPDHLAGMSTPQLYRRKLALKKRRERINAEIDGELSEINALLKMDFGG